MVINFGVHDCASNEATMYCWPEHEAKRGSDEVASCLLHTIENLPDKIDTLLLYSDACGGQNRNAYVMAFLYSLVRLGKFKEIKHVFPIRGHSFLPCDRDFGLIETM